MLATTATTATTATKPQQYSLNTANYQQFKQGPFKDHKFKYGDLSNMLYDGNKQPSYTSMKPKEPKETDYAVNPQTGETTNRLAYQRETPQPGEDPFNMDLTTQGRSAFQNAQSKYSHDEAKHQREHETMNKHDTDLVQAMLAQLSPATIHQLELNKDFSQIFTTPTAGEAPHRAYKLFKIMEATFNKADPAGIAHSLKEAINFRRDNAATSVFEFTTTLKKHLDTATGALDPQATGYIAVTDLQSALALCSFGSTVDEAELRALRAILKMGPPVQFGRSPLLPVLNTIIAEMLKEVAISESTSNTTTTSTATTTTKAFIVAGGGKAGGPITTAKLPRDTVYDAAKHCNTCYKLKNLINRHLPKYCRTAKEAAAAAAAATATTATATAATTAATTTAGAKALITTTTSTADNATAAAHAAEIARMTAMLETQKEMMNNQQETLRGLLGSISGGPGSI